MEVTHVDDPKGILRRHSPRPLVSDALRSMTLVEASAGVLILSNDAGDEMVFHAAP